MNFPITSEPGRWKYSEKGSLKTLDASKLQGEKKPENVF
jgi:hypothetical protein